jgi:hypothetical protein
LDTELAEVSAILSVVVSASSTTKVDEKHRIYSKSTALYLCHYKTIEGMYLWRFFVGDKMLGSLSVKRRQYLG